MSRLNRIGGGCSETNILFCDTGQITDGVFLFLDHRLTHFAILIPDYSTSGLPHVALQSVIRVSKGAMCGKLANRSRGGKLPYL